MAEFFGLLDLVLGFCDELWVVPDVGQEFRVVDQVSHRLVVQDLLLNVLPNRLERIILDVF